MESPPPAALDRQAFTATLSRAWSLDVDDLRYVPKGFGSFHWTAHRDGRPTHFVTVDDLDTKPWLGRDRASTFEGLTGAYETAWTLRHEDGIEAVVAPIRGEEGSVLVRLSDQLTVSVFPFVDGRAGAWREPLGADDRVRLLGELATLHGTPRTEGSGIRRRLHELPERAELLSALEALDRPWTGGELSEPSRRALVDNEALVRARLARFDDLATQLDRSRREVVVTHGEPHPGNLIHTPDRLWIIDWDTVALAEPERDLWMLADDLTAYTESTGRDIDEAAIELYGLMWTLSDIASFATLFRLAHERTGWAEQKWQGWVDLVKGGSSTPYGPG